MTIDYLAASESYRPEVIHTLLVGESPPPSGKSYFYVPTVLNSARPIRGYRSLPATIFYHYFRKVPKDAAQYAVFLEELKRMGIFLVDICDRPIKVRGSTEGHRLIVESIASLRPKLKDRCICVPDERIVFLLARSSYRSRIKTEFPQSKLITWIDFRMAQEELLRAR